MDSFHQTTSGRSSTDTWILSEKCLTPAYRSGWKPRLITGYKGDGSFRVVYSCKTIEGVGGSEQVKIVEANLDPRLFVRTCGIETANDIDVAVIATHCDKWVYSRALAVSCYQIKGVITFGNIKGAAIGLNTLDCWRNSPISVQGEALKVRWEQGRRIKDWSCRRTMNWGSWPRHGPSVFVRVVDQRDSLTLSSRHSIRCCQVCVRPCVKPAQDQRVHAPRFISEGLILFLDRVAEAFQGKIASHARTDDDSVPGRPSERHRGEL